jgi:hypothetical protein
MGKIMSVPVLNLKKQLNLSLSPLYLKKIYFNLVFHLTKNLFIERFPYFIFFHIDIETNNICYHQMYNDLVNIKKILGSWQ